MQCLERVGREDKRTNNRTMLLTVQKKNTAAGYQCLVKIELLKGAGLLCDHEYLTNRFHFAVRLYSDNAQMTSKRGENND